MIEIIPSKWMRDYLKDKKEFTDRERATLIWNAPNVTWRNRISSLSELARQTSDDLLKKQIIERIEYEQKLYADFCENFEKEYVYVVIDGNRDSCGFFGDAQIALQFGIKNAKEWNEDSFSIEKHLIISLDNKNKVIKRWYSQHLLQHSSDNFECEYSGEYASCIRYTSAGDILSIDSNEMSDEENERVDEFSRDRFEFQFFQIPFGMETGTIVKILNEFHRNEYAVLGSGEEEWNNYMNMTINNPDCYDFSDIQTTVYILNNDGTWSHGHINPLFLEAEIPEVEEEYINSKAYMEALCALGELLKNPTAENNYKALEASRHYAEIYGYKKIDCVIDYQSQEETESGDNSISFSDIFENIQKNIRKDTDAQLLFKEVLSSARDYVELRSIWQELSPQEIARRNAERSFLHDSFILEIDALAKYLKSKNNKRVVWRERLGNNRRRLGDFAEYIVKKEETGDKIER